MAILFYRAEDPYGCFSNFSRHPVDIYGRVWRTSEHAFQAMKFLGSPVHMDAVFNAPTPGQAANKHGRNRSYPLRKDWDLQPGPNMLSKELADLPQPDDGIDRRGVEAEPLFARVKDVVMYEVCLAKFSQRMDLKAILLGTGQEVLIEDTTDDAYWGWGTSKVGENKLGRILMLVRQVLGG